MIVGHEHLLVPRHPVLHLHRRADAATAASPTRSCASPSSLVGHVRGGLGMANVVACTLFGGVSGSPVADVSAMGAVMIPMMKKEGYDADYAVNVTTHAALVGALMPTSHNMIIYSLAAGGKVSIGGADRSPACCRRCADAVHPGRRLLRRGQARLSGRQASRAGPMVARSFAAALPGPADRGHHPRRASSPASSPPPNRRRSRWSTRSSLTLFVYRTMTWEQLPEGGAPRR